MAKYRFHCDACEMATTRLLEPHQVAAATCRGCGGLLRRTPVAPTTTVMEVLDNGHMTKAVERPADAERLYHERARADNAKE